MRATVWLLLVLCSAVPLMLARLATFVCKTRTDNWPFDGIFVGVRRVTQTRRFMPSFSVTDVLNFSHQKKCQNFLDKKVPTQGAFQ